MSNSIVLLQQQIERAEPLKQLPIYNPQYEIWCDTTAKIIRSNFDNSYEKIFESIIHPSMYVIHRVPDEARADFFDKIDRSVQLLQAIIDEYNRFQHTLEVDISRSSALNTYDFHKEIKAVSLKLYEDKYYPQAVEEAFKRVIKEVKSIVQDKTGQEYMSADDLMNKAFSPQNPVI